ncbi:MAG TPA: glycosyltransferase family 87 protein [Acidobacteriaceae bacterium]|nr:glycosyltransferase family 87 protein [Acidobacteriaceae bacterium]
MREVDAELKNDQAAAGAGWRAQAGLWFFLLIAMAVVVGIHQAAQAHYDFGTFYYAAHMVTGGARHQLYDLSAQHAWQARYHRPATQLFYYPPLAVLPYLLVSWLPMLPAFVLWTALSLLLLVVCLQTLTRLSGVHYGNWPLLLSLAFLPTAACLAHGQVSILILALYVVAYLLWRDGRRFLGGLVLSIATLKIQLVAGLVAVLLLRLKWRELAGFACGAAACVGLSLWMTGTRALMAYPAFVRQSEGGVGSEPRNMANWRGLIGLFAHHPFAWVLVLSVATVVWAARAWVSLEIGFSAALLAALLTSYHMNPQDLTLALLPFFLCRRSGAMPARWLVPLAIAMVLAPVVLMASGAPFALLAPLVIAALAVLGWTAMRAAPAAQG